MPATWGNPELATGLEKVSFHSNHKEGQCTLLSHVSMVILKIIQARPQQYIHWELPNVQDGFRKGRGTRDQIANICWIIEWARESRKTPTSASLTILKPLTVWITTNRGKFLEMRGPHHLTCLLKNLYADQKATARTKHGTMNWFQIGKGLCQGCILSPSLFNLYTVSSVQSFSHVQLFATSWTAACQHSLSITNSRSLLKLMSIESVMPSNHLILCCPLLLPSIFPSITVFANESVLPIRWPKYIMCIDIQSTSCEMLVWMKLKLESRLPREIPITSDMQMTQP